jgi:hypothetical protein
MHDQDIANLGEGWAMSDDGIVTPTMLETCKWRHNKATKALGYYTLKFGKKNPLWVGHKKLINKVKSLTFRREKNKMLHLLLYY